MYIDVVCYFYCNPRTKVESIFNSYDTLRERAMHATLVSTRLIVLCLQSCFTFVNGCLVSKKI